MQAAQLIQRVVRVKVLHQLVAVGDIHACRWHGDGAAVGKYRISVAKYDKKLEPKKSEGSEKLADPYDITNEYPTGYNEMQASEIAASLSKNLLHPKYSDPSTSKFEADVTKGANSFDFKVD